MDSAAHNLLSGMARAWVAGCQTSARAASGVVTGVSRTTLERLAPPHLHWERVGAGTPVLLIMGLGLSGGSWWRTVPVLARRLAVITFDNRGVGRSRALLHAYSTETMADDAALVLDAAQIDRAHVYGISLGGMVAQQLALRHPERVRSLVLGATHAGWRHARMPEPAVLAFLGQRLWMGHEAAVLASVPFNYSERCRAEHPERIAEDVEQRLAHRFVAQAYRAQMWAASLHDCYGRLGRIEAPTLVVHGDRDRMIPIENGRQIAARIPGAQLIELNETGHLYPTEEPSIDEKISAFMCAQS
jgi:pimeloyl-ACP methyl ester carboxylesterase